MTQQSRFFPSAQGDTRAYDAAEMSEALHSLTLNGVALHPATNEWLTVSALDTPGMGVKVSRGAAWVQGRFYASDAEEQLTIDAADLTYSRYDYIVLRLDLGTAQSITLQVHKGTAAATPVVPTLTRTSSIWEIALATITVPANITAIQANHVDVTCRADELTCGYAATPHVKSNRMTVYGNIDFNTYKATNLGSPTAATDAATKGYVDGVAMGEIPVSGGVPAGVMMYWGGDPAGPPSGWLICDGSQQLISSYPGLYAAIGTRFARNRVPTSGYFYLPDGRSNVMGAYDSRYAGNPGWDDIGYLIGEMAHAATSSGSVNLYQVLVTSAAIIKT